MIFKLLPDVGFVLKTANLPNQSFWSGNEKELKVLTELEFKNLNKDEWQRDRLV